MAHFKGNLVDNDTHKPNAANARISGPFYVENSLL